MLPVAALTVAATERNDKEQTEVAGVPVTHGHSIKGDRYGCKTELECAGRALLRLLLASKP